MEDVDDEKLFLEDKIAEMRDRRDIIKTSKPIPAASRDSVVDTMHIASNFSKKKENRLCALTKRRPYNLKDALLCIRRKYWQ